ncbi:MAG: hypothetical protein RI887_1080 [Actinomycetota bacterium]
MVSSMYGMVWYLLSLLARQRIFKERDNRGKLKTKLGYLRTKAKWIRYCRVKKQKDGWTLLLCRLSAGFGKIPSWCPPVCSLVLGELTEAIALRHLIIS